MTDVQMREGLVTGALVTVEATKLDQLIKAVAEYSASAAVAQQRVADLEAQLEAVPSEEEWARLKSLDGVMLFLEKENAELRSKLETAERLEVEANDARVQVVAQAAEDAAMLDWLEHAGLATKDGAPNVHSLRDMRTRKWSWTVYGRYFTDLRTAIRAAIGKPEVVAENATTGSEE